MIDERVEKAVQFMEKIAKDNDHGYDQKYRWAEYGDYDCSSLAITAFDNAGFALKDLGATYTGNMSQALRRVGFKNVVHKINTRTGGGLQRGDILLNIYYHVAVYVGNGNVVQASVNELGTAIGGKAGDQTGREIEIKPYYLYKKGWHEVLRYPEQKVKNGDDEMVEIIKIESNGKVPTVNAINKDGSYFVKLRDLAALGLLKVDYNKATKRPIVNKA